MNRQNATQREPRLFHLVRHAGVSGVSGTGTVAEGVEWSDGAVALRWRGRWPTTSLWESGLDAVLAIHGHDGATVVRWLTVPLLHSTGPNDSSSNPISDPTAGGEYPLTTGVRVPTASADGLCARCGQAWPCLSCS